MKEDEGIETVDNLIKLLMFSLFFNYAIDSPYDKDFYFRFIRFFVNEAH